MREKVMEYAMLECERDLEIAWSYATGELRLFGWPTADAHRMRQATWRSERLIEHLHGVHGHLSSDDGEVELTLSHFAWHRPFYHPWWRAFCAPTSYPFEFFACWLAGIGSIPPSPPPDGVCLFLTVAPL